ncbi:hypothetical protein OIU77_010665 [Salix suchowensis]|uniref:Secreted peptide n=1 Tax=Salix suchowensis TaxID=1278906 RepID=A0ABQ9A953_9ROSI|nr:hypothetical protein OIU77_010665 [Salix suchowensis]
MRQVKTISILVSAALICLWVLLAVLLQRIGLFLLGLGMACSRTQLLHFIPCRCAFSASCVTGASLLRFFYAPFPPSLIFSQGLLSRVGFACARTPVGSSSSIVGLT